MAKSPALNLGAWRHLDGSEGTDTLVLPAKHLVTHGVVVGMTGSGKTGLVMVLVEEALNAGIPTIVIDVKGDLPNLLLSFPSFDPLPLVPWVEARAEEHPEAAMVAARELAELQKSSLEPWGIDQARLRAYCDRTSVRVITPGASSGESLHVLSALERRSSRWDSDPEIARDSLSAAVSLVLRLLGRDPDPAKSREHVMLSVLAENRLAQGQIADIATLMRDLQSPPMSEVGALPVNAFLKKRERSSLAAALNNLLASPTFSGWRKGASLDVAEWVTPRQGRTPAVIVSVAHLDEEERSLVLGVLLEEILSWVRGLRGTDRLRALVVFDEVYGYMPPHPANPPTKRPLVALMKQARAFGVGVVVATQNPMDLDYRALSNAGLWCIGRLQTDADRERVLDGLMGSNSMPTESAAEIGRYLQRLAPRWFILRNAHVPEAAPITLHPRHAISLMRGPMTRREILDARKWRASLEGVELTPRSGPQQRTVSAAGETEGEEEVSTV